MAPGKPKITESERSQIANLRNRVEPGLLSPAFDHDFNLLRVLEYTKFDENKALKRLLEHLLVREYLGLDGAGPPQRLLPSYVERWPGGCLPLGPAGVGPYENHFICLAPFNEHMTTADLSANITHSDFFRCLIVDAEEQYRRAQRQEKATGRRSGVLVVINAEGLRLDLAGIHPIIAISNFVVAHFPHYSAKNLVVNSSGFIEKAWKITRHLFPETITSAIDFCSADELQKYVRPDSVPVSLGGSLRDDAGDPACSSIFRTPRADKAAFLPPFDPAALADMDLKDLCVPRGGKRWVTIHAAAGQRLSWFYFSHGWHSFALFFSEEEEGKDGRLAAMPVPYFTPTAVPEKGQLTVPKAGFYRFRFGNEGAIFSRLHIQYKVDLE